MSLFGAFGFSDKLLEAFLSNAGGNGWELVRLEPVASVGREYDWKVGNAGEHAFWISVYFVVLRKKIEEDRNSSNNDYFSFP